MFYLKLSIKCELFIKTYSMLNCVIFKKTDYRYIMCIRQTCVVGIVG